jgi:hypothetical protein
VVTLPEELASVIALHKTPLGATRGASALVVMTNAREFTLVTSDAIIAAMSVPIIIDSNAVVSRTLATDPRVRYFSVGRGQ